MYVWCKIIKELSAYRKGNNCINFSQFTYLTIQLKQSSTPTISSCITFLSYQSSIGTLSRRKAINYTSTMDGCTYDITHPNYTSESSGKALRQELTMGKRSTSRIHKLSIQLACQLTLPRPHHLSPGVIGEPCTTLLWWALLSSFCLRPDNIEARAIFTPQKKNWSRITWDRDLCERIQIYGAGARKLFQKCITESNIRTYIANY